ncbi:hypothetical protein [Humisphaera borealis]|uniref:Uncharacterized protein n=1 Tax=Humisphaera borealis TaxID=2807512 RepID=A0A7M2WV33_9BACT|nr:hypothetical protein [Humisphaera borealis]QOV89249.1 hypothetical protein IPV69_24060 [Humisphaera borealis]
MAAPRPTPVLSYTGDQPFGWREDPDGDAVLMLPHASNWSPLLEHAAGLMAATFFMICVVAFVVYVGRSLGPDQRTEAISAIAVGFLAIGIWVWVVVRCIRQARGGTVATVELRVSPGSLEVTQLAGRDDVDQTVCWERQHIAEVRFSLRPATFFRPTRVRLLLLRQDGVRDAIWLPWPECEPVGPHEQRLRGILNLPAV